MAPNSLKSLLNMIHQGIGDNARFLRHIRAEKPEGGVGTLFARHDCSRIYLENKSKVQSSLEALPGHDGLGPWVPNMCALPSGDSKDVKDSVTAPIDSGIRAKCFCGATSYYITKLDDISPGQILVCHCREIIQN